MLKKTKMAVCSAMLLVSILFVASPIAMGLVETKSGQQQIQNSDDYDGGIITGNYKKGYKRTIFNLQFESGKSTEYTTSGISNSTTYNNIILSCCVKALFPSKQCDFSIDDMDCDKYINRSTGRPYESMTCHMGSIL